MPSHIKKEDKDKDKVKSILRKPRVHNMKLRAQKLKRVKFLPLTPLQLSELELIRKELREMPGIISTEATREQEAKDRILWRQELELKRLRAQNSIFTQMYNFASNIYSYFKPTPAK